VVNALELLIKCSAITDELHGRETIFIRARWYEIRDFVEADNIFSHVCWNERSRSKGRADAINPVFC
jgi:hypothetical protein